MIEKIKEKFNKAVLLDEPMSHHTTFSTGGQAEVFIKPENPQMLAELMGFMQQNSLPYFILGGGSNILVSDKGFSKSAVISLSDAQGFSKIEVNDDLVTVLSGAKISSVLRICIMHSLSGLEFLCGIPGTIGGALFMNAGAFGDEIFNYVVSVDVMDKKGSVQTLSAENITRSYRSGIQEGIVVKAVFKLKKEAVSNIKEKCAECMKKRNELFPKGKNAGSVFKNPEGDFAGRLIEDAGLKGFKIGDAEVSPKHANFIVNTNSASAKDITDVITHVCETVKEKSGIKLMPEIKIVGE